MPIVLIVYLMLVCAPVAWPAPVWGDRPLWSIAATLGLMAVVLFRLVLVSGRALKSLAEPHRRSEALIPFGRARGRSPLALMLAFGVALTLGGWGWTVQNGLAPGETVLPPGAELLIVAPFLVSLVTSWLVLYPVERAALRAPGLADYLLFQFRHQVALALLPFSLMVFEQGLLRAYPETAEQGWFVGLSAGMVVLVLVFAPWLLRLLLGWRSLPRGPLRDMLLASARRLQLRYSDLMIWPTHDVVANAMVAGLAPYPRYIMMTDRLVNELTPDELESVLGHEIGHVRHHHMALYLSFFTLSMLAATGLVNLVWRSLPPDSWLITGVVALDGWATLIGFLLAAVYVVIGFGFISRRCEREADLFGCRAISCGRDNCQGHEPSERLAVVSKSTTPCPTAIDIFASALERVAVSNGISRSKPGWLSSWQHATIAQRVAFLESVKADPRIERQFSRRVRLMKWMILLTLIGVVAALIGTGDLPGPSP